MQKTLKILGIKEIKYKKKIVLNKYKTIFVSSIIKKVEIFSKNNIRVIRPGFGIEPVHFKNSINKKPPLSADNEIPLKKILLKKLGI
jgi:sialic acid synthase SpsE